MRVVGDKCYPNKKEALAIIQYIDMLATATKKAGYDNVSLDDLEDHRILLTNML